MHKLVEKLRKQREFTHDLEAGKSLIIRRMSEMDYTNFLAERELKSRSNDYVKLSDFIKKFVVDWRGFVELDFDPGSDGTPVPYDAELLIEWLQDRVILANELSEVIWRSWGDYLTKKAEAEKK